MKLTIALLFLQPKSSVSRCYINKTKPGASSSWLGWALNKTVTTKHFIVASDKSLNLSGQNWLQQEQWLDPPGRCWPNGEHPQTLQLQLLFFCQVTRLCEAAGWGEELARVEVETLEALVKGQAWHQAESTRSRLWSFVQILSNQDARSDWKLSWKHTILAHDRKVLF